MPECLSTRSARKDRTPKKDRGAARDRANMFSPLRGWTVVIAMREARGGEFCDERRHAAEFRNLGVSEAINSVQNIAFACDGNFKLPARSGLTFARHLK